MGYDLLFIESSVNKKKGKNKIIHEEPIKEKSRKGLPIDYQKLSQSLSSHSTSSSNVIELMIGFYHLNIAADNLLV